MKYPISFIIAIAIAILFAGQTNAEDSPTYYPTEYPTDADTTYMPTYEEDATDVVFCLTKQDCTTAANELGLPLTVGNFPTKGCFKKKEMAFYSQGTEDKMSTVDLPGDKLQRVFCNNNSLIQNDEPQVKEPTITWVHGTSPIDDEVYDAVIIGAGWAGISAALTLLDKGVSSILVLEASDHVGGRSKSVNSDGSINVADMAGSSSNVPHDMGSEWLYRGNVMEQYLKQNGLLEGVDLYTDEDGEGGADETHYYMQSVDANGRTSTQLMREGVVNQRRKISWDDFLDYKKDGQSYYDAAQEYKSKYLSDNKDIQFMNMMATMSEIYYTGELKELAKWYKAKYDSSDSTHYMSYKGVGYGNVAAKAANPLQSKIKLNSKVVEVNSSLLGSKQYQTVKYVDENGDMKLVKAKTVLVTVSLGVLKAGTINFIPKLPSRKQDSIDNMGFGLANKCAMEWENEDAIVWPNDVSKTWFQLVTPQTDTSGKWTHFSNPSSFKGKPVLTAWNSASDSKEMKSQTDEEILDDIMQNLRAMFPTITRPDKVIISRWDEDENVRGTYSFHKLGRDFDDDSYYLGETIGKQVWFAGEATAGNMYATTVGAWETGEKAAKQMAREILDRRVLRVTSQPQDSAALLTSSSYVSSCHLLSYVLVVAGVVIGCF